MEAFFSKINHQLKCLSSEFLMFNFDTFNFREGISKFRYCNLQMAFRLHFHWRKVRPSTLGQKLHWEIVTLEFSFLIRPPSY